MTNLFDKATEPNLSTHERAERLYAVLKENITDPRKCVTLATVELVLIATAKDARRKAIEDAELLASCDSDSIWLLEKLHKLKNEESQESPSPRPEAQKP